VQLVEQVVSGSERYKYIESMSTITYHNEKLDNNALFFYYSKVFPIDLMVEWLSYQKSSNAGNKALARREFSLSLPADDGGEIYMRWLCFPTVESWKSKLTSSIPYPHKMDIGALYSLPLSMKEVQPHRFRPLEKEVITSWELRVHIANISIQYFLHDSPNPLINFSDRLRYRYERLRRHKNLLRRKNYL